MRRNELIRNTSRYIWIVFIAVFAASCAGSKSFVNFEVLKPAEVTFPRFVEQVGFLNRAPFTDDVYDEFTEKMDRATLIIMDSMVVNNLVKGIIDGRESDEISYIDSMLFINYRRRDTVGMEEELTWLKRTEIMRLNELDALLSIEYFKIDISKSTAFYSITEAQYVEEFRFVMELLFRIYGDQNPVIIDQYKFRDTLYYTNMADAPSLELLNPSDVIRAGSYEFGYKYGRRLVPAWNHVSRILFRGGSDLMRTAAVWVDNGEWEKALPLWEQESASENEKLAAKALHNMALYYETGDNIEKAYNCIEKAHGLWENQLVAKYYQDLDKRRKEVKKVLEQLHQDLIE